ncbi:hypothetical protein DAEQUDRAFT_729355 [Daedalea quercina L-15889]|uniref:BBC1/AIM3 cysteine proteinase-fold domain-containing protein n=1 Tax=Daedalea quercina L-15889 TaxID=1314783 RepID=A0A165NSA0_9APHY|nr:hypothetical protein DAEQUDRAFT_729355 [Daedalea quercina L-15889]
MSDLPKKPGSLRDRIAAFENKGATAAPAPPAPRPKPAGGVSWKPQPRSPPPASNDEASSASKPGGMSAADAKVSIGQGGSLKERMAALQGLHAFGGSAASPPPKPATEKPKWKPPPVVSPPPADGEEKDEAAMPDATPEGDHDVQEQVPISESGHAEGEGEGEAEPDPEEEERQRRAAIAVRMARLGGARVGMAPPVFGRKPDIKKPEVHKAEDEHEEKVAEAAPVVSPPIEPTVASPPETASVSLQKSETAATDYFESKDSGHLSPESGSTPPVRSPAMPVPAGPRRAAPPRKRAAKSPSPAPTTVLQEGAVHESPTPLPNAPSTAPEISVPSAVEAESIGPHGDREPELTGSKVEAILENVNALDMEVAEETKEALTDDTPPVATGPLEAEHTPEATFTVQEDEVHVNPVPWERPTDVVTTEAEIHESVAEPAAISAEEHLEEVEVPGTAEQEEPEEPEEETEEEEEEAARRKRIAERLAKAGGVNPLSGPIRAVSPPVSPPLGHSIPVPVERRQSLRKDSHGSVTSEKPSSPRTVPASPRPEVPRRQGSMHSVHSQASADHPTRRASQDERRYSVGELEPAPEPVSTIAEEIVEEPEPYGQHEAVHEEQEVAKESYVQETGDEHGFVQYAEPAQIQEGHVQEEDEVQEEEEVQEEAPPPPPPRRPSGPEAVSPHSRSASKRLSVPPPRPPPPPPHQEEPEERLATGPLATHEPVKRLSVPPVAPPRPPPPPPSTDAQQERQPEQADEEDFPPPVHRELRPAIHHPGERGAHEHYMTPKVTHIVVDNHDQLVLHSGASGEAYEDDTYREEPYPEPGYEGDELDASEDDDPVEVLAHSHDHETGVLPSEAELLHNRVEELEEEAPPPPPRRSTLLEHPPHVTSPLLPPARRPSTGQTARLASPPPVPTPAPIVLTPPAKDGNELLDDSDGDPIDPSFYNPPKSPSTQTHQLPVSTSPQPAEEQPQPQLGEEAEQDPEQARRRTIAERMAKLGGIRFGAPPPPPVRRPHPPPEARESEEGVAQELEAETQEVSEEEDEFARKQRIAARIAGMGGMRFGMMPGAAPPIPRAQARPTSPPASAEEQSQTPSVPHRTAPVVSPPEPSEDDGEPIEPEESEAEEVTYEEAQEEEEEAPPIPSREGRQASHAEAYRPPVPQTSRPPVPQVPTHQPPKRMSMGPGIEASSSSNFTYPPPPPARRPSIPTRDTQNDFVMVGNEENAEEPPPPPPRTVSLKKAHHPPSRTAPHAPPPLSAELNSGIPPVDFGGETDLSLSGQWSEDSTNYPPPPPPTTKGEFVHPSSTRSDVQLPPEELMKQWGRVGVQIHETASVLFDKSKKTLVGDGSYLGFVTAVLSQVPNAAHPAPPFDNFGYLIYMQTGGSVQRRVSDVMPGDVVVIQEAKFKGHKGLQSYSQTAGVGEPLYALVSDYEAKKSKVRVFQANQHVGQQTVQSVSYRLEDLKSGSIKIFRVLEA